MRGKKRATKFLLFIIALSIGIGGGLAYWYFYIPNEKTVPAFAETGNILIFENEIDSSHDKPKIIDGELLFPFETVKKYIDPNIYWDASLKKVTITTEKKVIRMQTDSLQAIINNKPVNLKIPVTLDSNVPYLPLDFLKEFYNIEIKYIKDKEVIIIDPTNKSFSLLEVTDEKAVVRTDKTIRAPIVRSFNLLSDTTETKILTVFGELDKWYKVRTHAGEMGYVEKRYVVSKGNTPIKEAKEKATVQSWKPPSGKINLVWEMMYGGRPNFAKLPKMDGLDVVSPTWFSVLDEKGTLENRTDTKYLEWAKQSGFKVWALVANDFKQIEMTSKLLNNTDSRDNIIRQLLSFAALYKLDGINFDFENIYKADKDAYSQFIREAAPLLREQGLVVSADVTIPDGSDTWSLCYDRKALAEACDYIMLMTYDQHWDGSPKAGSIAQMSWVETNLKKTLTMIPQEKLLLGLPYYTRLWKEEQGAEGKFKITSQVLSMESAKKNLKDNNANVIWDEISGQFYGEYKKDSSTYKLWLEDENSINLKSSLVQKYGIAGSAAWRRSDELPEIWGILNKNLKQNGDYQAWLKENSTKKYVFN